MAGGFEGFHEEYPEVCFNSPGLLGHSPPMMDPEPSVTGRKTPLYDQVRDWENNWNSCMRTFFSGICPLLYLVWDVFPSWIEISHVLVGYCFWLVGLCSINRRVQWSSSPSCSWAVQFIPQGVKLSLQRGSRQCSTCPPPAPTCMKRT